eukprot:gnl/TRDRNA2_/TRDRNA2_177156_c0_seq2.p1 gnl/TRDRNA2_/TRDRNA2_177156_c0~~gnl/TRDRNA2_/TRDRNA2_177156_c0_seq2.p1  ORF type:complete len:515 (+),score=83.38 gnl/TRDRNA2_/TRDRNA2_177156_c0_seq2:70-1614(+)
MVRLNFHRHSAVHPEEVGPHPEATVRTLSKSSVHASQKVKSMLAWPGRRSHSKPTTLPSAERKDADDHNAGTDSTHGKFNYHNAARHICPAHPSKKEGQVRPVTAHAAIASVEPSKASASDDLGSAPVTSTSSSSNAERNEQAKAALGLAARRGKGIGIATKPAPEAAGSNAPTSKEIIRIAEGEFAKRYKIGNEVMPSCHKAMEVLFATRLQDSAEVVVKRRGKSAFEKGEERQWRATSEMLMNLPPSEHICKLHEILEDSRAYYVVMEKVEGDDLFETLSQGHIPLEECKVILKQLLDAIAHMHAKGCIHKDLKLENVMIDRTLISRHAMKSSCSVFAPALKLIDLDTAEAWTPLSQKKAKHVQGTDQYISQEAYAGNYSPASDMFAVGVIAYKLLTNHFPFDDQIFNYKPGDTDVDSNTMIRIRKLLVRQKINWDHKIFKEEPMAMHLVKGMLSSGVPDRTQAPAALKHPFLVSASLPHSKDPKSSSCPQCPESCVSPYHDSLSNASICGA